MFEARIARYVPDHVPMKGRNTKVMFKQSLRVAWDRVGNSVEMRLLGLKLCALLIFYIGG